MPIPKKDGGDLDGDGWQVQPHWQLSCAFKAVTTPPTYFHPSCLLTVLVAGRYCDCPKNAAQTFQGNHPYIRSSLLHHVAINTSAPYSIHYYCRFIIADIASQIKQKAP
jgi:hypothetical protein